MNSKGIYPKLHNPERPAITSFYVKHCKIHSFCARSAGLQTARMHSTVVELICFDKLQVHHPVAIQFKARDLFFGIARDMNVVHEPEIVEQVVIPIQYKRRIVIFRIAEE